MKTKKKSPLITEEQIEKIVAQSCKLEGIDYYRAKKNKAAIRLLKKLGRANRF
ncbi:MAG: hypothetical protein HY461_02895 [Parcubacteria group bacterium]|nr:hypothetical protein [Parcubacteria group bacterium]